jgi:3-isopropylmalate/(R)-2-methylmalate dehydratase small subunit
MILKGKTWKFGNNIDTDAIIPARYLNTSDPDELAKHIMEDADKDFPSKVSAGDLIVAESNFGCGSSREHAPIAIKAAGISGVIAKSFARIFYRNSFNIGLPIFESAEAVDKISEGDEIEVDADNGIIKNITKGEEYSAKPIPPFMQELISAGGLVEWTKKRMKAS